MPWRTPPQEYLSNLRMIHVLDSEEPGCSLPRGSHQQLGAVGMRCGDAVAAGPGTAVSPPGHLCLRMHLSKQLLSAFVVELQFQFEV